MRYRWQFTSRAQPAARPCARGERGDDAGVVTMTRIAQGRASVPVNGVARAQPDPPRQRRDARCGVTGSGRASSVADEGEGCIERRTSCACDRNGSRCNRRALYSERNADLGAGSPFRSARLDAALLRPTRVCLPPIEPLPGVGSDIVNLSGHTAALCSPVMIMSLIWSTMNMYPLSGRTCIPPRSRTWWRSIPRSHNAR